VTGVVRLFADTTGTPVGELTIVADADDRLRACLWLDGREDLERALRRQYAGGAFALEAARDPGGLVTAVAAYFGGRLDAIDGLAVAAAGTPFQLAVWAALREIPCGTTASYGEIARRIGNPAAVRAVGLANGANPVAVVVPCHRVVGANGTLTGYGGGLARKRWLLDHEAPARVDPFLPFGR
jgi:methylated-DNA-[protein]-cysteine S-methyltransferase